MLKTIPSFSNGASYYQKYSVNKSMWSRIYPQTTGFTVRIYEHNWKILVECDSSSQKYKNKKK